MAYSEKLSARIREALMHLPDIEEKYMFGGMCFMVNGKMCIGVSNDDMMCRIDPAAEQEAMSKKGARPMDFTGRPMKGYVFVSEEGIRAAADFNYWISLCLDFNSRAKASKKRKA